MQKCYPFIVLTSCIHFLNSMRKLAIAFTTFGRLYIHTHTLAKMQSNDCWSGVNGEKASILIEAEPTSSFSLCAHVRVCITVIIGYLHEYSSIELEYALLFFVHRMQQKEKQNKSESRVGFFFQHEL